jgi:hypothetical protein
MNAVYAVRDDPVWNVECREIIIEWKQPGLPKAAGHAIRNREA